MKKCWIYTGIALILITGISLMGYHYMDNQGYFDTATAIDKNGLSLSQGIGGGLFIAIIKYIIKKIIAIFVLFVSLIIAFMVFIGLGFFTFTL